MKTGTFISGLIHSFLKRFGGTDKPNEILEAEKIYGVELSRIVKK